MMVILLVYHTGMNNTLSYCGLVDARIRASNKDLPVRSHFSTSVFEQILVSFYRDNLTISRIKNRFFYRQKGSPQKVAIKRGKFTSVLNTNHMCKIGM